MIWYRLSLVRTRAKSGKVVSVDAKNGTVVVEGINKVFKHSKPSMANQQGGILHLEAPHRHLKCRLSITRASQRLVMTSGTGKDKVRVAEGKQRSYRLIMEGGHT